MIENMGVKERIYEFAKSEHISIKRFEELCGMANGYVSSMRKGLGADKLSNVLTAFPELNRDWLLYGEGEMLKTNSQTGSDINNQQGNGNNYNISELLSKALDEIAAQRKLTETMYRQIDRLLSIIESKKNE